MPRIYNKLREPFDLCQKCYQDALDEKHFSEGSEFDAEHPGYEDTDYECDYCHKPLKSADNHYEGVGEK